MDVRFGTEALRRCYQKESEGRKAWNAKIARTYIRRVNQLYACVSQQDVRALPAARLHRLKGGRASQWALDLDHAWRLVVKFPTGTSIILLEVTDHYDD